MQFKLTYESIVGFKGNKFDKFLFFDYSITVFISLFGKYVCVRLKQLYTKYK